MRRVLGFCLFFTGIGMAVGLIAPDGIEAAMIAAVCMIGGYNLFCGS